MLFFGSLWSDLSKQAVRVAHSGEMRLLPVTGAYYPELAGVHCMAVVLVQSRCWQRCVRHPQASSGSGMASLLACLRTNIFLGSPNQLLNVTMSSVGSHPDEGGAVWSPKRVGSFIQYKFGIKPQFCRLWNFSVVLEFLDSKHCIHFPRFLWQFLGVWKQPTYWLPQWLTTSTAVKQLVLNTKALHLRFQYQ